MTHFSKGILRAYYDRELPGEVRQGVADHLAVCGKCTSRLQEIVRDSKLCSSVLESLGSGSLPQSVPPARLPGDLRPLKVPFGGKEFFLRPLPVPAPFPLAVIALLVVALLFPVGGPSSPGKRESLAGEGPKSAERETLLARLRVGSTEQVRPLRLPKGRYRPVREPEVHGVP